LENYYPKCCEDEIPFPFPQLFEDEIPFLFPQLFEEAGLSLVGYHDEAVLSSCHYEEELTHG